MIPTNGSTMTVVVDGVALGTVGYNLCRATPAGHRGMPRRHRDAVPQHDEHQERHRRDRRVQPRHDEARQRGAHDRVGSDRQPGSWRRDRQPVLHGAERIRPGGDRGRRRAPSATDGTQAQAFVRPMSTASTADAAPAQVVGSAMDVAWLAPSTSDVSGRRASTSTRRWKRSTPTRQACDVVRMPELGRIELQLGDGTSAGYLNANGTLRPLPPGSQLNTATGQVHVGAGTGLRRHV